MFTDEPRRPRPSLRQSIRPFVRPLRGSAILGAATVLALTAACATKSEAKAPEPTPPIAAPADKPVDKKPSGSASDSLEGLPGIDLTSLDDGQKHWLKEDLDKYPSPCGKSESLYKSLKGDPKCKRALFAGRYFVMLLKAGLMQSEAEEHYEDRFVHPELAQCDITDVPVRGNPTATVSICEFSDFQCPHCKLAEPILSRILEEDRDHVKLYYKNYPISKLHPDSRNAAAAAVAAGKQGKFWQMHDLLFDHQDALSPSDLEKYAASLKLDVKKWKADLPSGGDRVDADHDQGEKLEITGTPTIYINGRKYKGPMRYEDVKDWVDEEMSK